MKKFKNGDKVLIPEWNSRNETTEWIGWGYIIADTPDGYLVLSCLGYHPIVKQEDELELLRE